MLNIKYTDIPQSKFSKEIYLYYNISTCDNKNRKSTGKKLYLGIRKKVNFTCRFSVRIELAKT